MSETESSLSHKWRDLICRQRAGGLSVAAFCRRNGVAGSSFFAWKRKIGSLPAAPAFVEATVVATPPAGRPAGSVEVRLRGGRRVRVCRGFDRDLLAEVIAVLEALAPAEGLS
jgi:transposase